MEKAQFGKLGEANENMRFLRIFGRNISLLTMIDIEIFITE